MTSQNLGNSKIDAYLRRTITYRAKIDPDDGQVRARLVIRLHNDAPADGLPRIVIGNNRDRPNGTNLLTLTVHSSLGLSSVRVGGRTVGVQSGQELGLHAYLLPVEVGPRRSTTSTLDLAGGLDLTDGYRLTARAPADGPSRRADRRPDDDPGVAGAAGRGRRGRRSPGAPGPGRCRPVRPGRDRGPAPAALRLRRRAGTDPGATVSGDALSPSDAKGGHDMRKTAARCGRLRACVVRRCRHGVRPVRTPTVHHTRRGRRRRRRGRRAAVGTAAGPGRARRMAASPSPAAT